MTSLAVGDRLRRTHARRPDHQQLDLPALPDLPSGRCILFRSVLSRCRAGAKPWRRSSMSPIVKAQTAGLQELWLAIKVLKGVSFEVAKGEMIAIIGASGSGKSTALRCIDRLEIIDEGSIEVCGHPVDSPTVESAGAAPGRRHRLPELQPVPASDGRAEHHAGAAPRQEAASQRSARDRPARARSRSVWRKKPMPIRSSSRAASSSAWRSPARWPCRPR